MWAVIQRLETSLHKMVQRFNLHKVTTIMVSKTAIEYFLKNTQPYSVLCVFIIHIHVHWPEQLNNKTDEKLCINLLGSVSS